MGLQPLARAHRIQRRTRYSPDLLIFCKAVTPAASRTLLALAVAVGGAIRFVALPLPGTTDTPIFAVWARYAAIEGVGGLYGTGGVFPQRRVLESGDVGTKVDYPPLALSELGLAGRFERVMPLATAIKLLTIAFEATLAALVFATARRWRRTQDEAAVAALGVWLNPASIMIAAVLGYVDPLFVLPAVGALAGAVAGHPAVAGALIAAACLTKPLAILIAPCVVLAIWNTGDERHRPRRLVSAGAAAAAATVFIVLPVAARGGLLNMLWGLGSLLRDPWLSGSSASLWTIVMAVTKTPVPIDAARVAGAVLTLGAVALVMWRARDARDPWLLAALGAFAVHAYATLAVAVHENHLYAAVPLLALAIAGRRRFAGVFAAVSAIAAFNLYFAYGFGVGVGHFAPQTVNGIDVLVLLAAVNAAVFAWHAAVLHAECAATLPGPTEAPRRA